MSLLCSAGLVRGGGPGQVLCRARLAGLSRPCFSTSSQQFLRRKPSNKDTFLGINKWFWVSLQPGRIMRALIEQWMRRKWKKERFSTEEEKYRQNLFHRVTVFYAMLTWTGVGLALYMTLRPKPKKLDEATRSGPLPHEEELNRGGALWWTTTLKQPDGLQNSKPITKVSLKGLNYRGSEDITLEAKEVGQAMKANITGGTDTGRDDHYLRHMWGIKQQVDGGPSPADVRKIVEAKGYDYELSLNRANRTFGVATRYNADGTVGTQVIRSREDLPAPGEVEVPEKHAITQARETLRTMVLETVGAKGDNPTSPQLLEKDSEELERTL